MTHLRYFILIDENGEKLVLTPDGNIPTELYDSTGKNLDLTDLSNVPVEVFDSTGKNIDLTDLSNVPVELYDSNGLNLDLETDSSVPATSKNDFFLDVSKGAVAGHDSEFKFGRSELVTTTESVIWDQGGNYTFITSPETIDLVSTAAADNAAGLGARSILVSGLDANYDEVSVLIVPTGLTPVTTTQTFIRVFRALVVTSGTNDPINDANLGDIIISGTTSTAILAKILINNGQTLMAVYTVPDGKTAYVTGISLSAGQGKQCLFKAKFRNGPTSDYAFSVKFTMDLYESHFFGSLTTPLRVPERTDIVITGQTSVGTIDAGASFGATLIDN